MYVWERTVRPRAERREESPDSAGQGAC